MTVRVTYKDDIPAIREVFGDVTYIARGDDEIRVFRYGQTVVRIPARKVLYMTMNHFREVSILRKE